MAKQSWRDRRWGAEARVGSRPQVGRGGEDREWGGGAHREAPHRDWARPSGAAAADN